eukprot:SAG11_NODE_3455_length_2438_cov_1.565626_3_plen_174_part_00
MYELGRSLPAPELVPTTGTYTPRSRPTNARGALLSHEIMRELDPSNLTLERILEQRRELIAQTKRLICQRRSVCVARRFCCVGRVVSVVSCRFCRRRSLILSTRLPNRSSRQRVESVRTAGAVGVSIEAVRQSLAAFNRSVTDCQQVRRTIAPLPARAGALTALRLLWSLSAH